MRAAIFEGIGRMTVKEAPDPTAEPGGAVVRVRACAVCGSDVRIFRHGNARVVPPQVLGHEIAGEVVAVGEGVDKFKAGDRVAIGADVPCGSCAFCEAGIGNNCAINYAMGYQFPGGFAEYVPLNKITVSYGPVHILPDKLSYGEGALAEPLACVLNALELSPVKLGDTVAVIGAGPIGMMICEVAKMSGASKVILVNRSRPRLTLAEKLGAADVYIDSSETDAINAVLNETGGSGVDVVITSNSSGDAQAQALAMAKNRARVNFFGGLPKGTAVTLDTNAIHYKELTVTGAHGSTPAHHVKALALIDSGRIGVKKYLTHSFGLDEITEAFSAAEGRAGLRVAVNP